MKETVLDWFKFLIGSVNQSTLFIVNCVSKVSSSFAWRIYIKWFSWIIDGKANRESFDEAVQILWN